jgi:hypothetical protein
MFPAVLRVAQAVGRRHVIGLMGAVVSRHRVR